MRRLIIVPAIALAIATSVLLTGCTDIKILDNSADLVGEWERSDNDHSIELEEDKTGRCLSDGGGDYYFTWDFSPNLDNRMVWVIQDYHETRMYEYYVLGEDKDILVLRDESTGNVWSYYKR